MPEAPTRVPAMISRLLLRVNPEAATASPVKELSREMSTGTSAPPMGRTKITPSTSASRAVATSRGTLAVTTVATASPTMATPTMALMHLLGRVGDRTSGHQLLQLGEGDGAPGERHAPDQHPEEHLDDPVDGGLGGGLDEEDHIEMRAAAPPPDPVEDGHHLGHRRHLDLAGGGHGHRRPDGHGHQGQDQIERVGPHHRVGEGHAHRHGRRRRRQQVAVAGVLGRAQTLEGQDEPDGGQQVDQVDPGVEGHRAPPVGPPGASSAGPSSALGARSAGLALNISSMRSVTTKPPTMLRVARSTAKKASVIWTAPWASPMIRMVPTSTIPWMALDSRHQRRVEDARNGADDLDADERGQDEDRQELEDSGAHDSVSVSACGGSPTGVSAGGGSVCGVSGSGAGAGAGPARAPRRSARARRCRP